MVERQLPKLNVVSSSLITRFKQNSPLVRVSASIKSFGKVDKNETHLKVIEGHDFQKTQSALKQKIIHKTEGATSGLEVLSNKDYNDASKKKIGFSSF